MYDNQLNHQLQSDGNDLIAKLKNSIDHWASLSVKLIGNLSFFFYYLKDKSKD